MTGNRWLRAAVLGFSLVATPPSLLAQDDPEDYFLRAQRYERGDGIPADLAQALALYRKAADLGHVEAQFTLGVMHHGGHGTAQDAAASR